MNAQEKSLPDDFMDKSVNYTPEAILASMKDFYENILTNPKLGALKTQLVSTMIAGTIMTSANPAMAALPEG